MAVSITDDRTIVNEADSTSTPDTWTGSVSMSVVTADPNPIESTGCIGQRNNNTTTNMFVTKSGVDFTAGQSPGPSLIYVWLFPRTVVDTKALGGMQVQLGDGTNRIGFHLAGDDAASFRHDSGPAQGWQCLVLDTVRAKNGDYASTALAGTLAGLNMAAITQFGAVFKATVGAQGNVPNTYVDIIRRGAIGQGITVAGGTSGTPGKFEEIATEGRGTGNQVARGIFRKLGTGLYGAQGPLTFGDPGTAASWFEETNTTLVFEDRTVGTDKYIIKLQDNGTGTATFKLGTKVGADGGKDGVSLIVPSGVGGKFDASDTDLTDVFVYGSRLQGFSAGILLAPNLEFMSCIFAGNGQISANGAKLLRSSVSGYEGTADTAALKWDVNTNPSGFLNNMQFIKGTAATHAIEFGTNAPTTLTLDGLSFSGYNAADGQTDSSLLFADKGSNQTWNVTISNGAVPTYKKARAGDTVNMISSVTVTLTGLVDGTEVRVYKISDNSVVDGTESTSGGSWPFSAQAGLQVYIRIFHVDYLPADLPTYTIPGSATSVPIQQVFDRNYTNPPGP